RRLRPGRVWLELSHEQPRARPRHALHVDRRAGQNPAGDIVSGDRQPFDRRHIWPGMSYAELNGPLTVQTGPIAGAPSNLLVQGTGFTLIGSAALQYLLTDDTTI